MFDLTGKTAIVTGASRGIGHGIAETLAGAGAHVVCVSRHQGAVDRVAGELNQRGCQASAIAGDVAEFPDFETIVKHTLENHGRVDILVNNAGITRDTLLIRMSDSDWDTVLKVNLKGAFNGLKAVARPMLKQRSGRIINITSVVGLIGNAGQANYAASKAGLIGLTRSAAKELASRGITVNAIAPGYIDTDMTAALNTEVRTALINQIPLGRIGTAADVAALALFLSADESAYITGQVFTVDGGMTIS